MVEHAQHTPGQRATRPPYPTDAPFAAIEAGGTKWVCALGDASGQLFARHRFPTRSPQETLAEAVAWLRGAADAHGMPQALGMASFGPLELAPAAPYYGRLLRTPKPDWSGSDLLAPFRAAFPALRLALDTDVNAAALAEAEAFARQEGRTPRSLVYLTVGTGIGGGVVVEGRPLHGLLHPELGHLHPRRHADDLDAGGTPFAGICPYHGDCLEGLASGPALHARLGHGLDAAAPDHTIWAVQADYLGQCCAQIALALSPERIVIGGGVMQQARLFPLLRARTRHWLGGYLDRAQADDGIDAWIVPPALGQDSGLRGALRLATMAAR